MAALRLGLVPLATNDADAPAETPAELHRLAALHLDAQATHLGRMRDEGRLACEHDKAVERLRERAKGLEAREGKGG